MRRAIAGITAAGLLACAPLAAAEAKPPITEVSLTGATAEHIIGAVSSPSERCLGDRAIRIGEAGGATPATAVSDADGHFQVAVAELPAGASSLAVTVLRPPPGPQRACKPDSAGLTVDAGALTGGVFGETFRGRLTSSLPECVPDRTVEVYEVSSEPVFVGFNFTDSAGEWVLVAAGGTYEARSLPVVLGGPEAFTYCRSLISPSWFFEEPV